MQHNSKSDSDESSDEQIAFPITFSPERTELKSPSTSDSDKTFQYPVPLIRLKLSEPKKEREDSSVPDKIRDLIAKHEFEKIPKMMGDLKAQRNRREVIRVLVPLMDPLALKSLVRKGVLNVLYDWLKDILESAEKTVPSGSLNDLVLGILKFLDQLPIDVAVLVASGVGKAVQKCNGKSLFVESVKTLAGALKEKWTCLIKDSASGNGAQNLKRQGESMDSNATKTLKTGDKPHVRRDSSDDKKVFKPPSTSSFFKTLEANSRKGLKPAPETKRRSISSLESDSKSRSLEPDSNRSSVSSVGSDSKGLASNEPLKRPTVPEEIQMFLKKPRLDQPASPQEAQVRSYRKDATLTEDKKKKKSKSVTWKPEAELCQIRILPELEPVEKDSEETEVHVPKTAKEDEKGEGKLGFAIHEELDWYSPPELLLKYVLPIPNSAEIQIQVEREKRSFSAVYFRPEDIPISPAEPTEPCFEAASVPEIPFDDHSTAPPVKQEVDRVALSKAIAALNGSASLSALLQNIVAGPSAPFAPHQNMYSQSQGVPQGFSSQGQGFSSQGQGFSSQGQGQGFSSQGQGQGFSSQQGQGSSQTHGYSGAYSPNGYSQHSQGYSSSQSQPYLSLSTPSRQSHNQYDPRASHFDPRPNSHYDPRPNAHHYDPRPNSYHDPRPAHHDSRPKSASKKKGVRQAVCQYWEKSQVCPYGSECRKLHSWV